LPCKKCNSPLIYFENKFNCPQCNNLKILKREQSLIIAQKRALYFRNLWKHELKKYHRDSLLLHIVNHREMLSWEFFQKPGISDVDQLFSDTLFIKRVFEYGNKKGEIIIDNEKKSQPLIKLFNETKRVEIDISLVDSENATYLYDKEFDIDTLSDEDALKHFTLVQTEEYEKLLNSYGKNNLYTRKKAEEFQKANAEEYKKILETKPKPISQTRAEFIERNYDTICSFYLIFLRNEIYSQVFDLRKFQDVTNDPSKLMEFIKKFPLIHNKLNGPDYSEFLTISKQFFNKSEQEIKKLLIFEDENLDIFPLFVRVDLEGKDIVLLPQAFTGIMYIFLHAVITKDIFDSEADKRGLIFEGDVQKKFELLGYQYLPNHKDNPQNPTLEIDGITYKNEICYVIECKNPRLPPIVESYETRKNMLDDLKGIVDGFKRTTKNGERVTKSVPSLPAKINYVNQHLSELNLTKVSKDKIFGLILTQNYPLLSNYKGFNIMWLSDISNEILEKIINEKSTNA